MCLWTNKRLDSSQLELSLQQAPDIHLIASYSNNNNPPLVNGPDLRPTFRRQRLNRHLRRHSHTHNQNDRPILLLFGNNNNWLELTTPPTANRLGGIEEFGELINRSEFESETTDSHNDDKVRYLDFELLESILRWLNDSGLLSSVAFLIKAIRLYISRMTGNDIKMNESSLNRAESQDLRRQGFDGDNDDGGWPEGEEAIDFVELSNQARDEASDDYDDDIIDYLDDGQGDLFGSSDQIRARLIESLKTNKLINSILIICHAILFIKCGHLFSTFLDNHELLSSFSGIFLPSNSKLSLLPTGSTSWFLGNPSQFLLVVSLLDLLGSIHWYYSKESFKTRRTSNAHRNYTTFVENKKVSWLKWITLIIASPCHTFRLVYAIVLNFLGPIGGSLGLVMGLYNSFSQILSHMYNCHRIELYLNLLNQDENNTNTNDINLSSQRLCRHHSAGAKRDGWSNWPLDLATCYCEFKKSQRFRLEKLLMLIQVIGVKLTIFSLLYYIDNRHNLIDNHNKLEDCLALFCLVEAFLAVHFYYDKYQTRYMGGPRMLDAVECE